MSTSLKIQIQTTPETKVRDYLNALNGILSLTERELDVLESLYIYDPRNAATTDARIYAANRLKLKSVAVLNNFIKAIVSKNALVLRDKGGESKYTYHPLLINMETNKQVLFQFN